MQKESEVILVVKEFVKAAGAPDAIICDHLQAQTSSSIESFVVRLELPYKSLRKELHGPTEPNSTLD
eukprot:2606804-Ditylum_brightwellii.AAC.1